MSSMQAGVSLRLFQDIENFTGTKKFVNQCIMNPDNLYTRRLSAKCHSTNQFYEDALVNHSECKEFLKDLETQYGNKVFNTQIRFLNTSAMLKRVYNLKE